MAKMGPSELEEDFPSARADHSGGKVEFTEQERRPEKSLLSVVRFRPQVAVLLRLPYHHHKLDLMRSYLEGHPCRSVCMYVEKWETMVSKGTWNRVEHLGTSTLRWDKTDDGRERDVRR